MQTSAKTTWEQRVSLVALGLTSALVLLELGLRLGAAVYIWNQGRENRRAQHGSDVTILCIGESTTALGGDDAYPAQLQRLLNAEPSRPDGDRCGDRRYWHRRNVPLESF